MRPRIKSEAVEAPASSTPQQSQATVMKTVDEEKVESLSDLGDLLIEAGGSTEQPVAYFKVSQVVLSHASQVWKSMVARSNLKVIKIVGGTRDYTLRLLELPDDDPTGLRTLLQIAHLQFELVPTEVCWEHLLSVAQICNRYQTQHLVVKYIDEWMECTRELIATRGYELDEELIWILWVFDRQNSLRAITGEVMGSISIREFSDWELPEPYQGHVLRNMEARHEAIISRVYGLLGFERCAEILSAGDSEEKWAQAHGCEARRHAFALQVIGYGLALPLQDRPDHAALRNKSLEDIMHNIEFLEWLALRKIDGSRHAKCAAKITKFHNDLQEMCISLDDVDEELAGLVRVES